MFIKDFRQKIVTYTISKGQHITIPSEYRKDLNLKVGSKVDIVKKGNAILINPIDEDLGRLFEEAKNIKPKHKLNARQMDKLIEDEVLG